MNAEAKEISSNIVNGLDTNKITALVGKIQEDESYGKFQFRANNRWINGAKSKTSIKGFFAGGKEDSGRSQAMFVDADQPAFLAGGNTAPNPVEHLLHALTSCLTTTLASHAAVQGINIGTIETSAVGELNSRGLFGLSEDVSKGYESIKVTMRVES